MKKNFVTFYSPGTFVAETTTHEIDSWDVETAIEMSKEIKERYGATPYGFKFSTRERGDDDLDSHVSSESGMYYLGGTVYTLDDLELVNNPDDYILIQNMKSNGYYKVVVNNNSWKWTQPLEDRDTVLEL